MQNLTYVSYVCAHASAYLCIVKGRKYFRSHSGFDLPLFIFLLTINDYDPTELRPPRCHYGDHASCGEHHQCPARSRAAGHLLGPCIRLYSRTRPRGKPYPFPGHDLFDDTLVRGPRHTSHHRKLTRQLLTSLIIEEGAGIVLATVPAPDVYGLINIYYGSLLVMADHCRLRTEPPDEEDLESDFTSEEMEPPEDAVAEPEAATRLPALRLPPEEAE